jgi:hypothetical protein
MNIKLPPNWNNRQESILKCMVNQSSRPTFPLKNLMKKKHSKQSKKYSSNKNTSLHNGRMTLYDDASERDTTPAATSLTYSDNLHAYDFYTSPPLILRSYPSFQSSNNPSKQQQQQQQQSKDAQNQYIDSTNKNMKFSTDYIHRLIEQNERRYEQQEHITTIGREWQLLSQVVDRLLVFVFLISTMLVFFFIFRQAPLLRLK